MTSRLIVPLTGVDYPWGKVWLPLVRVRAAARVTRSLAALVDTGASFTLASRAFAPFFGFDDAALGAAPTVRVQGLGGVIQDCPRVACDLLLGTGDLRERLELQGATVIFTRDALPIADVLLGQVDALERMELVQRNFAPHRDLILKLAR